MMAGPSQKPVLQFGLEVDSRITSWAGCPAHKTDVYKVKASKSPATRLLKTYLSEFITIPPSIS
jgi:hypothetical protein